MCRPGHSRNRRTKRRSGETKKARGWALPAELGDPSNMNDLGIIYNAGNGVPRDPRIARQWFEKAAALGNPEAKQNLRGMRK
jgi:TPR repeat protein